MRTLISAPASEPCATVLTNSAIDLRVIGLLCVGESYSQLICAKSPIAELYFYGALFHFHYTLLVHCTQPLVSI